MCVIRLHGLSRSFHSVDFVLEKEIFRSKMSEPGKYVLPSKNIKKAKKQIDKKLKKKLENVQPKKVTTPKSTKQNETNLQSKKKLSNKKKKIKQNPDKKQKQNKLVPPERQKKNQSEKVAVQNRKSIATLTEPKKSFGDDLSDRLSASRFRFINEQLYTQTSEQALEVFEQDDSAFNTYHEGYRKQIEQWPINPLDRIIKSIKKLPLNYVIADFGCGEARLAESISQKCYSFDLVAANNRVIACNMAQTPLPSDSVNVAVFCLSLMGTNLKDFLLEANRVLKIGGHLKIAEIESRFDNVNHFIFNLKQIGFDLLSKDVSTKVFYFLNFTKARNVSDAKKIKDFSLKPCIYKKR